MWTRNELWPWRPSLLPDETFSSWFARLAAGNGLSPAELYRVAKAGAHPRPRDLDRYVEPDLQATLAERTGIEAETLRQAAFTRWAGLVFEEDEGRNKLYWLPLAGSEDSKRSFGQQFCPACLREDDVPHLRLRTCLDPFMGSGTTALTCSFLGIDSVGVEVNPFLADLSRAKITPIAPSALLTAHLKLTSELTVAQDDYVVPQGMPQTMREPGVKGRYLFPREVFGTVRALVRRMDALPPNEARLLRVLLGSVLIQNSNVIVNGKGRRYRENWALRERTARNLLDDLELAVQVAVEDFARFPMRPTARHLVIEGDARRSLTAVHAADIALFSPPYPNSFDYTDVYNLELWMLGYLKSAEDNLTLRGATLRSHVQTRWDDPDRSIRSPTLDDAVARLQARRMDLWNRHIPEMVLAYFDDIGMILRHIRRILAPGRHAVVVIGDSKYAGVHVDVAQILQEAAKGVGFRVISRDSMRSMRNSAQHGGAFEFKEHCIVMERT